MATEPLDLPSFDFSISGNDRINHYKARGESGQKKRRDAFLARQKEQRCDLRSHARLLAMEVKQEDTMAMETEIPHKLKHKQVTFRDQLMLCEPLLEMPNDLADAWYVSPCPTGRRCIVVSSRNNTIARLTNGAVLNKFHSLLPNGSPSNKGKPNDYCILDCIFYEPTFTYYILDMMCWKGYPLYECDTEFRFYWKLAKLGEVEVSQKSEDNPYQFIPLPYYDCSPTGIRQAMTVPNTTEYNFARETLLFYNKATHYTFGNQTTPLVCSLDIKEGRNADILQSMLDGTVSGQ